MPLQLGLIMTTTHWPLTPIFAQNGLGLSELHTGFLLIPGGLTMGSLGPFESPR